MEICGVLLVDTPAVENRTVGGIPPMRGLASVPVAAAAGTPSHPRSGGEPYNAHGRCRMAKKITLGQMRETFTRAKKNADEVYIENADGAANYWFVFNSDMVRVDFCVTSNRVEMSASQVVDTPGGIEFKTWEEFALRA